MMTGARNAGTLAAYVRAEQNGMHIQKQWMAALDERTRASHRHLDGETKAVTEKFSNGLMHPGDTTGRPEEVYNCRCTMVPIVNDQLYEGERASKLKDMSYEEWRNAQPKSKSKAKKKKKTAGKQVSNEDKTTEASENKVTEIPKNKEDLINTLDAARDAAVNDPSKIEEYRQAVRELSENVPFGEFFENQLEKKHILALREMLDKAREKYPELAKMYEAWQSQFRFDKTTKKVACYWPQFRKVSIKANKEAAGTVVSTPYQTFFHELGHLIDNQSVCPTYGIANISERLTDVIKADWAAYRDKTVSKLGIQNQHNQTYRVIEHIRDIAKDGGGSIDLKTWGDVSDIIEGCTGIRYPLGAGHGAAYHKKHGATASEFFAEVCSAAIANPASFEKLSMIFPNAVDELMKIVKELAG